MKPKVYSFEIEGENILIETREVILGEEKNDGIVTVSKDKREERRFDKALNLLHKISKSVVKLGNEIQPDEFELEMGIGFAGKIGVPFIANTASEGTLKVTIKWKNSNDKKGSNKSDSFIS